MNHSGSGSGQTPSQIKDLLSHEFISGQIELAQNKVYTLDLYAIDERDISFVVIKTTSGTCTAAVKIDGVSITGMSAISVTSVESIANASALNSMASGQTLTLEISNASSPADLVFTLKYERV